VFRYHVQFVHIVCVSVEVQAHFHHSDKQMIQERIQLCVEAIEPHYLKHGTQNIHCVFEVSTGNDSSSDCNDIRSPVESIDL